ncbi:hypothetical protein MBO_08302 [Moraxella bovoculi 237]|uniref:UPF0102 protein MBO_08302 n=1 Tax=Moraxella bovoculi 237 TaxID=743974 RepID=A0A066UBS4_9GAMM|nr:YraN family protein [Moraxella bovoculi]KDN24565.1 hypothetical protein MBO_08302 [Moraxella bovoculi 237]
MNTKATTKSIGDFYENRAVDWIESEHLTVIARNYNVPKVGEIDIVAKCIDALASGRIRKTLVFIEVRARKRGQFASSAESITTAKQYKIIHAAMHFLQEFDEFNEYDCRFDVIVFDYADGEDARGEWIKAAFLAC